MEITATYNFTFILFYGLLNYCLNSNNIAKLVKRPTKVPVWSNSTDVGSNHEAAKGGRIIQAAPSVAEIRALFGNK